MLIAITRVDGGVSIMNTDSNAEREVAKWQSAHPGEYASHVGIKEDGIPADRAFRAAWVVSGDGIAHNMEKARALHLTAIRAERNALLDATDALVLKAAETGDTATEEALKLLRQRLRDIPADIADTITAAKDPAELKEITSEALADAKQVIDSSRTLVVTRA